MLVTKARYNYDRDIGLGLTREQAR